MLFVDVEEVRFGQSTDGFARLNRTTDKRTETLSFSIVLGVRMSFDLIASSAPEYVFVTLMHTHTSVHDHIYARICTTDKRTETLLFSIVLGVRMSFDLIASSPPE